MKESNRRGGKACQEAVREKERHECGDESRLIYMDILCVQETKWK